uniref:Secreted protein n=1 Tax=Arundo donax TaxID=35708 RepID=A0A0A9A8U5_ARUDO
MDCFIICVICRAACLCDLAICWDFNAWSHIQMVGQCTGTIHFRGRDTSSKRISSNSRCFHFQCLLCKVNSNHPYILITRFQPGPEVKKVITICAQRGPS